MVADVARTVVDPANVVDEAADRRWAARISPTCCSAVPGAYFWLGHDGSVPVHNPGFILDDNILPIGASLFARIIETRLPASG